MHERLNTFYTSDDRVIGDAIKLGIAADLQREWAGSLNQPIPENLRRLVDHLEERICRRSHAYERSRS